MLFTLLSLEPEQFYSSNLHSASRNNSVNASSGSEEGGGRSSRPAHRLEMANIDRTAALRSLKRGETAAVAAAFSKNNGAR